MRNVTFCIRIYIMMGCLICMQVGVATAGQRDWLRAAGRQYRLAAAAEDAR